MRRKALAIGELLQGAKSVARGFLNLFVDVRYPSRQGHGDAREQRSPLLRRLHHPPHEPADGPARDAPHLRYRVLQPPQEVGHQRGQVRREATGASALNRAQGEDASLHGPRIVLRQMVMENRKEAVEGLDRKLGADVVDRGRGAFAKRPDGDLALVGRFLGI
eukprot:scaffold207_cov267-Pinguiococcus_pyrenoidosus.AAC.1